MAFTRPREHLDEAALRARVREAGTGELSLDHHDTLVGAELAAALAEGPGLTGLEIRGTELGADGWRAVLVALQRGVCLQLTTLSLRGPGTAEGAALAAALRGCPQLARLHIELIELGAGGWRAVAEALRQHAC
eukprot:COSAG04_NODE_18020_length_453_cov_0.912429_1_plen_133_part_10